MSWEEYERLDEDVRYEYVDGCLVVNPRPRVLHQIILVNVVNRLNAACPPGYRALAECGWKPGADEWAPDVMVCQPDDTAVRFTGAPELIAEILSTNPAADLVRKFNRYAAEGLPRYWIVNPLEPSVRAYELCGDRFEEVAEAIGDDEVEFDFGVGRVTLRPGDLLR